MILALESTNQTPLVFLSYPRFYLPLSLKLQR